MAVVKTRVCRLGLSDGYIKEGNCNVQADPRVAGQQSAMKL